MRARNVVPLEVLKRAVSALDIREDLVLRAQAQTRIAPETTT